MQPVVLFPGVKQGYAFTYDGLNRLLTSSYGEGATFANNAGANNENLTYDNGGNIKTLVRYKKGIGMIDNLTYTYKAGLSVNNGLERVDDAVTGTAGLNGFSEVVKQSVEYTYDQNGNLTSDANKGFNDIQYNYLKLPKRVGSTPGQYISYIYDAVGTKLAKVGTDHILTTWYAGSFVYWGIYSSGSLKYIIHPEGLYLSGGNYQYFLKDHLGNTRLAVNTVGTGGTIVQQTDYYPFGMDIANYNGGLDNKYRYNGKEFQTDQINGRNLDWYDYGARFYDPTIGRFHTIDPMSEKYYSISPYVYCLNNPIKYIDIDGMDPIYGKNFWGNTKLIGDDGKEDSKAYIVKGSEKREVKSSTKEGKNYSGSLSESENVMKVPTGGVKDDIINSVDETLTSQNENGGSSNTGDINATRWDEGSPAKEVKDDEGNIVGAKASMKPFMIGGTQNIPTDASNVEFYWHTHPNTKVGGVSLGYSTPSDADKSFQGTMQNRGFNGNAFVIGTRSNSVTFYNKNRSLITIKYSDFKKIGGK